MLVENTYASLDIGWIYIVFRAYTPHLPQILPIRPKPVAISNFHSFKSYTNIN